MARTRSGPGCHKAKKALRAVAGLMHGPGLCERRAADWLIGGAPLPAQAIEVRHAMTPALPGPRRSPARTCALRQPCMTVMLGVAVAAALTGAAGAARARTGPATRAPVVPIVRMAGARTVRQIRMMGLHMRQPRRTACELVLAATPGTTDRTDHRQSSADYRK
jgi:hypothetical protein